MALTKEEIIEIAQEVADRVLASKCTDCFTDITIGDLSESVATWSKDTQDSSALVRVKVADRNHVTMWAISNKDNTPRDPLTFELEEED